MGGPWFVAQGGYNGCCDKNESIQYVDPVYLAFV